MIRIFSAPYRCELSSNDAYFSHDVKILTKKNLEKIKTQIRSFFREFKGYKFSSLDPEFINQKLATHNLYNDSFIETLLVPPKK